MKSAEPPGKNISTSFLIPKSYFTRRTGRAGRSGRTGRTDARGTRGARRAGTAGIDDRLIRLIDADAGPAAAYGAMLIKWHNHTSSCVGGMDIRPLSIVWRTPRPLPHSAATLFLAIRNALSRKDAPLPPATIASQNLPAPLAPKRINSCRETDRLRGKSHNSKKRDEKSSRTTAALFHWYF